MLHSDRDETDKAQLQNLSSLRTSEPPSNPNGISIKSIQIVKYEFDSNPNQKLTISLVFHQLNDELRKLVRYVSSKYAMNLYSDWNSYWTKQKQMVKTEKQKGRNFQCGQGQLIVSDDQALTKVIREMKINPTLRVALICLNIAHFQLKQQYSFVLVTDDWKQLQQYLTKNKKKIILTSKN